MLNQLCGYLRNWFIRSDDDKHFGEFAITGGVLTSPFLVNGQYYRIVGSLFNDGVHRYGDVTDHLTDETFTGAIWCMYVPAEVVELAGDISEWETKNGAAARTPYASESFGGYSYTLGRGSWKTVFADRLSRWRKL